MSTRSITHFVMDGVIVARIYRHCDGYPSGAGTDLYRFLRDVKAQTHDTRFSDPDYLAAKYVVWLAHSFAREAPLDFLSVGVTSADPSDIEYRYVVDCSYNREPTIKCYSTCVDGPALDIPLPDPDEKPWMGGAS